MKRARHRAALRAGLAAGLALIAAAGPRAGTPRAPSSAATSRPGATGSSAPKPAVRLDPRERAARDAHGNLLLEVRVEAQDTYPSLARQYLADPDRYRDLRHGNGRHVPAAGGTIRIPYAILSDARKLQAIDDLFPRDRTRDGDWVHRAGEGRLPASEERLRDLALWLTGDDDNSDALAEKNGLSGAALARGQEIVIPGDLLLPPFAAL